MASDPQRQEDIDLGRRVPAAAPSRELMAELLRVQTHMGEDRLTRALRRMADRMDELAEERGTGDLALAVRMERGGVARATLRSDDKL
jgi:hypothetical protein